jgi:TetR/AcrR family transcriptional regulator
MAGVISSRTASGTYPPQVPRRRSEAKRARIVEAATNHFAEHGYPAARMGDIAEALGIAKGSIFQHFGSKEGLFLEVYKRAVRGFPKYFDAPAEIREAGFFEVLRGWLLRTDYFLRENRVAYRIWLLGNHGTDLALKREINRFLITEDPFGTAGFVRFGLERKELRRDLEMEMIISMLDWMVSRFQMFTDEPEPGPFWRQGKSTRKRELQIQQILALLRRAIGSRDDAVLAVSDPQREPRKKVLFD